MSFNNPHLVFLAVNEKPPKRNRLLPSCSHIFLIVSGGIIWTLNSKRTIQFRGRPAQDLPGESLRRLAVRRHGSLPQDLPPLRRHFKPLHQNPRETHQPLTPQNPAHLRERPQAGPEAAERLGHPLRSVPERPPRLVQGQS